MTRAEPQRPEGTPWVDGALRDALRPFVAWFGYEFDLSGVTARVNSFSTSARPSSIWRSSIWIARSTSSGSKPAMTTGLRQSCAKRA